jgi:hypothetical protein
MTESLVPENEIKKELLKGILTKEFKNKQLPEEIFILSGGIRKSPLQKMNQITNLFLMLTKMVMV